MDEYNITKSKRKSFAIIIKPCGEVSVKVPYRASKFQIKEFITKNQNWIKQQLEQINNELAIIKQSKNLLFFLGHKYLVKENNHQTNPIEFTGTEFVIKNGFLNKIPQWYKLQTEKLVKPIIEEYSQKFNFKYTSFKITNAKSRWGSCNINGSICFSYRLSMLPLEVINYIVVHELTHLKHFNHSKDFWNAVKQICPDYKVANQWLKNNKIILANMLV
ncbi:MAG TPA: SprT family zinc-dependent metalloprotease [Burkholderiales bacterium]|nr:SprT family zinc-dependent metalloprotease [Burkholderiales bacterium]